MKKVQTVSIPEFMSHGFQVGTNADKVKSHLKRNQSFYVKASGITAAFLLAGCNPALATTTSGVDVVGHQIYVRLCNIGKWIIIIKGGIDIIGSMSNGDLESMKKQFIKYVVGFIALLALPWCLDEATRFFTDPNMTTIAPTGDGQ